MRFLVTNDDGYDAPGLQTLAAAARTVGSPILLAPTVGLSGCSHAVTTERPLSVERRGDGLFAVDGTPADCVRMGLHRAPHSFDWVLAGVNAGGNLGVDVFYSGTCAAVREGVLHGLPGVAFSQYRKRGLPFDWPRAERWVARVLPDLLRRPPPAGSFWNVNLPHLQPA
ncbi:MAG: 5'/3'-nucleotidase SurE, partial [Planctomycetia bacterium]